MKKKKVFDFEVGHQFILCWQLNCLERSIQGGFGVAQQKLLVRLVTRFQYESVTGLEDLMIEHIIQDQKARTELALLWIAELYSQLRGFAFFCKEQVFFGRKVQQLFGFGSWSKLCIK